MLRIVSRTRLVRMSVFVVIALLLVSACSPDSSPAPDAQTYAHPEALASASWLMDHLDDPSVRILDGRAMMTGSKRDYEAGHVLGAVYVDVWNDLTDPRGAVRGLIPPKSDFEALMGRLGVSNDTTVVVYDDEGGLWMARMWWALRYYGHENVKLLNGGLENWTLNGLPLEEGENVPSPADFTADVRPELLATLDDVQQAIADADMVLIDALPTGQYASHHIPSAVNVPAPDNLDPANHTLLPPEELAQLWHDVGLESQRAITYCGGGYYGSLELFALYQLGHEDISLYDASWAEWGADPDLPVETGSGEGSASTETFGRFVGLARTALSELSVRFGAPVGDEVARTKAH